MPNWGGGSGGGLAKNHIFSGFFLSHPSLIENSKLSQIELCGQGGLLWCRQQMNRHLQFLKTQTHVKSSLQLNMFDFVLSLSSTFESSNFFAQISRLHLGRFFAPRVIGCQTLGGGVVWKIGNRATPVLQTISQLISFSSALPPILSSSSQCKKRLIRRYVQCTLYIVQTLIFVEGSICKMFSREFESWLILCQQLLGPKIPLCWVLCFLQVWPTSSLLAPSSYWCKVNSRGRLAACHLLTFSRCALYLLYLTDFLFVFGTLAICICIWQTCYLYLYLTDFLFVSALFGRLATYLYLADACLNYFLKRKR